MRRGTSRREKDAAANALEAMARGERVGKAPQPQDPGSVRGAVNRATRQSPRTLNRRPAMG
jgi:hypothetical protein